MSSARRCRSFRYLVSPTVRQRQALETLLRLQCELYNAALEERRGAWHWERRSVSYVEQCRTLTSLRESRPDVLGAGVTVCRGTLRRLDWAFAAFYRRARARQRPGYPRFRPMSRWDSLQWEDRCGWRLDSASGRLLLYGIGHLKVRMHRPVQGADQGDHATPRGATLVAHRALRRRARRTAPGDGAPGGSRRGGRGLGRDQRRCPSFQPSTPPTRRDPTGGRAAQLRHQDAGLEAPPGGT